MLAPASKSSMQRACAAALVHKGKSIIFNPGISNDDRAALEIITSLGCECHFAHGALHVNSEHATIYNFIENESNSIAIDCGESGLSIRMFTPIAALYNQRISITGKGSLTIRPLNFFDEILPLLGVKIKSNSGKLPLEVKGPLTPSNITVDGSLSSQFLTGLLMAYSAAMKLKASDKSSTVSIKVNNLKSKPYIDLTLKVMKEFGLVVPENKNYEKFIFSSKPLYSENSDVSYTVEGDWSGGAFLLVAGAIAGEVVAEGLDIHSTQADKVIIEALQNAGAFVAIEEKKIIIKKLELRAFEFDATDCPDLFPPLVALAAYCKGITKIKGLSRLAYKESNRGITLQEEFGKMGVSIELNDDVMFIKGNGIVNGNRVSSHHDHRIAMACAVAGLAASGATIIEDADAISKSYPNFYEHLKLIGASVTSLNK